MIFSQKMILKLLKTTINILLIIYNNIFRGIGIVTIEIFIIFLVVHLLALIIGILLLYYSLLLLRRLKSKDFALSMIFLNEKKIIKILFVLVIGSLIFFIGQIYSSYVNYVAISDLTMAVAPSLSIKYVLVNLVRFVYSFVLLYFVYELQNILKGENYD